MRGLFAEIQALAEEMREVTLAAGVQEGTFSKVFEIPEGLTDRQLSERLEFLRAVRSAEYTEVVKVWRLLPPEIWRRYLELGETALREQRLLREARKQLRKVWGKRYGKEQASVQSVNSGGDPGGSV